MKIALVSTRGGHLTEILQLVDALKDHDFFFVLPHSTRDHEIEKMAPVVYCLNSEANIFKFMLVSVRALIVLLEERPDVILSMGPEIALPFFFIGKIFGMKTIYIESWARVENLSITGRFVYRWVDEFWVQWPQLEQLFPRAKYRGAII